MSRLNWIENATVMLVAADSVTQSSGGIVKGVPVAFEGSWLHINVAEATPAIPGRGIIVYGMDKIHHVEYEQTASEPWIAYHDD